MQIEIKITGPKGAGKTYAIDLIRKQLEHHLGHVNCKLIENNGECEHWVLEVSK